MTFTHQPQTTLPLGTAVRPAVVTLWITPVPAQEVPKLQTSGSQRVPVKKHSLLTTFSYSLLSLERERNTFVQPTLTALVTVVVQCTRQVYGGGKDINLSGLISLCQRQKRYFIRSFSLHLFKICIL